MTNDLNDREDQIIALKKREAALEENLKIRERMYAQDAQVRLQLGKRLEQVLMDKEEIKDELDSLKVIKSLNCFSFPSDFVFSLRRTLTSFEMDFRMQISSESLHL